MTRKQAWDLHQVVLTKIAAKRDADKAKATQKERTLAKQIEKLKETAPHDLLDAKIAVSLRKALKGKGKGKSKGKGTAGSASDKKVKLNESLDYGAAYSLIISNNDDKLDGVFMEPPGLEDWQAPFQKHTREGRLREDHKGQGKGKAKGKGKGKGKKKGQAWKKGEWEDRRSGGAKAKGKGKKGKGKGSGKRAHVRHWSTLCRVIHSTQISSQPSLWVKLTGCLMSRASGILSLCTRTAVVR